MTPRSWQWTGLAVGLVLFAAIYADETVHGPLYGMDQGICDRIGDCTTPNSPPNALNTIGEDLTRIVSVPYAVGLTVLAVVAFWLLRDRRMAVWAAVSGIVAGAAIYGLKQSIKRPLPPKAAGAWYGFSFPSGHTISAVANVGLLILLGAQVLVDRRKPSPEQSRRIWRWAVVLWAVFALAMGVGRILTQRHWATDVYASWAVGLALACAMLLVARVPRPPWLHPKHGEREPPVDTQPAL
jgi:undecaprenyl-diphosphatase